MHPAGRLRSFDHPMDVWCILAFAVSLSATILCAAAFEWNFPKRFGSVVFRGMLSLAFYSIEMLILFVALNWF
jgi:hypothetical protein